MLIQRGKFTIKNMSELKNAKFDKNGMRKVIDLHYMGKFQFEGNTIPISRMFIEYYKDRYSFIPVNIYNKNKEQMYIYLNLDLLKEKQDDFVEKLVRVIFSREFSINQHINNPNKSNTDFWWDVEGDYFIFFGEYKKSIIKYFIEKCYYRDGEKEEIGKKLVKAGYKIKHRN